MHKQIQGVGFSNNLMKNKKLNKEKKSGATTSPSLGNLAARAQLVDRALSKSKNNKNVKEFDSISNLKSKDYVLKDKKKSPSRVLKIIGASGLAVFMGVGTLLGVLIVPMNSANAGALNGAANTQSGLGSEGLNGGAGLSSGGAGGLVNGENSAGGGEYGGAGSENGASGGEAVMLDPKTDETIFTTESGFEIKSHTVAGQSLANSMVQYFTLGSYNGTPLNWIILATSPTLAENTTDAGIAINAANANGLVSMMTTSNLSANQALVISEKVIPISSATYNLAGRSGNVHITTSGGGTSSKKTDAQLTELAKNYALTLVDQLADYYTAYSTPSLSTPNTWVTGSTLGLSSYCGNKIVKNSNFNSSYYGFALTTSQISTYLPTNLRTAQDTLGTTRAYWCGDSYSSNLTLGTVVGEYKATGNIRVGNGDVSGKYYLGYNSSSCYSTFSGGAYVNTSGTLVNCSTITISCTIKRKAEVEGLSRVAIDAIPTYLSQHYMTFGGSRYMWHLVGVYSGSPTASINITAYYRPAMVIDLSKF